MIDMSKEEIIKGINKMLNECDRYFEECGTYLHLAGKEEQDLVQGLLDLYNKEKEKNKELEVCLKAEEKYAEGLNDDIKSLLNIEPNNNFIPKSKVREKIEILEKCTTNIDRKVNLTDYMIIGETERATGRFVNLDFIKKVLLEEPGYDIELLQEGDK